MNISFLFILLKCCSCLSSAKYINSNQLNYPNGHIKWNPSQYKLTLTSQIGQQSDEQPKPHLKTAGFNPIFRTMNDNRVAEEDEGFYDDDRNSGDRYSENLNRNDYIDLQGSEEYLDDINESVSDEFDDEFEKVIAEMHANANLTQIIGEITTPFEVLSDLAVDWFIVNMTNANPNIPFNMTPILYAQIPTKYKAVDEHKDHLQIVFSGSAGSIGHYILARFIAKKNVVYIYDSLSDSYLAPTARYILSRLYPRKKFKFVKPMTKQPDGASCGVFAIAYATTIMLGGDPATYQLQLYDKTLGIADKTMTLRRHIAKMYTSKKLEFFPGSSAIVEEIQNENNEKNSTHLERNHEENHDRNFEEIQNEQIPNSRSFLIFPSIFVIIMSYLVHFIAF